MPPTGVAPFCCLALAPAAKRRVRGPEASTPILFLGEVIMLIRRVTEQLEEQGGPAWHTNRGHRAGRYLRCKMILLLLVRVARDPAVTLFGLERVWI